MSEFIQKIENAARLLRVSEDLLLREEFHRLVLIGIYSFTDNLNIVFQGGSALHIFMDSPRFSLDLDFVGKFDVDIDKLSSWLNDLLEYINFNVRFSKLKVAGEPHLYRVWANFRDLESKKVYKIKIESLEGYLPPYDDHLLYPNFHPLKINALVSVEKPEALLAQKVLSFSARKYIAARDLFDIMFLREVKRVKLDSKVLFLVNKNYDLEKDSIKEKVDYFKNLDLKELSRIMSNIKTFLPQSYGLTRLIPKIYSNVIETLEEALKVWRD